MSRVEMNMRADATRTTSNMAMTGGRMRLTLALTSGLAILAGCGSDMDWDLRPSERFSTTEAARNSTAARPTPDPRGVISYPGYQVVVAQPGEQVRDISARLGLAQGALAAHNAIDPAAVMRGGELLVLPSRVDEATSTPGAITATTLNPATTAGPEPVQHEVRRGETAFSIARLYQVTPRSLAEWNGLAGDMGVREGQILVIPVAQQQTAALSAPLSASGLPGTDAGGTSAAITAGTAAGTTAAAPLPATTSLPGQGSATPNPPSAAQPLPATTPTPAGQGATAGAPAPEPVADLGAERTQAAQLAMPVEGRIIRAYARGRNDGIGIGAPAGTSIRAAAGGTVAAITQDTDQVPILVIRHADNLLTVYANIDNITVARGDRISRGQSIATVRRGDPSFLHFEVREGFESVDPMPYLQ